MAPVFSLNLQPKPMGRLCKRTDLKYFLVRLGMSTLSTTFAEASWLKELSWVEFSLIHVVFTYGLQGQ